MERRTSKLFLASAVIVAAFLATFVREGKPDAVYLTAYVVLALALLSLGLFGRGRALPVFAGTYTVGCVLWQWLWWTDAPELSGIDDIPPIGGFFITVPFALVLITVGWAGASIARFGATRR
jgi:hypothetical protein